MLNIKNLNIFYSKVIFENFSYSFGDGIYLIKGESGTGKTTLLDIIYGERDYIGNIDINDINLPYKDLNKSTLFSYLKSFSLLDLKLSLSSNIKKLSKCSLNINNHKYLELLEYFNFENLANAKLSVLSVGQIKIANIIFVFSRDTYFYLLDEPFSDLDENNKQKVKNYIEKNFDNKCIILINHENQNISFPYTGIIDLDNKINTSLPTQCSFTSKEINYQKKHNFLQLFSSLKNNIGFNFLNFILLLLTIISATNAYIFMPFSNKHFTNICLDSNLYQYELIKDSSCQYLGLNNINNKKYIINFTDLASLYNVSTPNSGIYQELNDFYIVAENNIEQTAIYNYSDDSIINIKSIFPDAKFVDNPYPKINNLYLDAYNLLNENQTIIQLSFENYFNLIFQNQIFNLKQINGENAFINNGEKSFYLSIGTMAGDLKLHHIIFDNSIDSIILPQRYYTIPVLMFALPSSVVTSVSLNSIFNIEYQDNIEYIKMSQTTYFNLLNLFDIQLLLVNIDSIKDIPNYQNYSYPYNSLRKNNFFLSDSLFMITSVISLASAILSLAILIFINSYFYLKNPLSKETISRLSLFNMSIKEIKEYRYFPLYFSLFIIFIADIIFTVVGFDHINLFIKERYFNGNYENIINHHFFITKYYYIDYFHFKSIDFICFLIVILLPIFIIITIKYISGRKHDSIKKLK